MDGATKRDSEYICQIYQEKLIFRTWHCTTVFSMKKEIEICG